MPDETLDATLNLSTDDAQRSVNDLRDQLVDALSGAIDTFSAEYAKAASGLPPADVTLAVENPEEVTSSIDSAVAAADGEVALDAPYEQLTLGIDGAVGAAEGAVDVQAAGRDRGPAHLAASS